MQLKPKNNIKSKWRIIAGLSLVLVLGFWFSLSFPLFKSNYSTVIYSSNHALIGAHVANDQQWRFPQGDSVPHRYKTSLIAFEDEYFYRHIGVNPLSILRATYQNINAGKIVSGGSTISMQLIRMAKGRKRNIANKLIESIQAVRLELSYSKEEIIALYAAHAPFGGNVVGIEAASWRYFQRSAYQLSWAESAMLAVLPNAPGLIHTGKNRDLLLKKRNRLLGKLLQNGSIDSSTYHLSLDEEIPLHPYPMPQIAPHLFDYYIKKGSGKSYTTSLDEGLQKRVNDIVAEHNSRLTLSDVNNAAAIVLDVNSGKVLAYCGNTKGLNGAKHSNHVDVIQARRSTGSVLKPFLYAAALQSGTIMPKQLLADIPTYYNNFAPQNYNRIYDGAVPANEALSRSLNIPAVRLLKQYDVARFCNVLQALGIKSIDKSPDYYGLSLILGGAEASLFELVGAYASMMRLLTSYTSNNGKYYTTEFQPPLLLQADSLQRGELSYNYPLLSAGAVYSTFEAMTEVTRPDEEQGWQIFASGRKIAWKTGTSFGYRDAWSIGVTPDYIVGVWVGNANGEGRPEIIGGSAAAPIMFDVFRMMPQTRWVEVPYDNMEHVAICAQSGYKAGAYCEVDSMYVPQIVADTKICPYHHLVHLNNSETYQVNSNIYPVDKMVHKAWFTLPPTMEFYYSKLHPLYKKLPPKHPKYVGQYKEVMEFVYPQSKNKIYLPKDINGEIQPIVLKINHNNPRATVYWHINDEYVGSTNNQHEIEMLANVGKHLITITDENGNVLRRWIDCVGRGDK